MTQTIEAIARALSDDIRAVGVVGHNVANLNTPGFRAGRVMPGFSDSLGAPALDLADGALAPTGRALDLALRGPGFFVVEHADGLRLARAGDLRLDAEHRLVDRAGGQVLGEGGPLVLGPGDVRVDADGAVRVDGRHVDRLRLVDVADPSKLQPASGGDWTYDGEFAPWRGRVVQGAIERGNADAAVQTVHLMELTRHAESLQRAISIYDKAMDAGINRLGEN